MHNEHLCDLNWLCSTTMKGIILLKVVYLSLHFSCACLCLIRLFSVSSFCSLLLFTHTKNSLQNCVYLPEIMQSSLNTLYPLFLSSLQRFISKWIHRLDQWTRKLGLVLFEESSGYGHVHGAQDLMNVIVMIIRSIWKFHEAV